MQGPHIYIDRLSNIHKMGKCGSSREYGETPNFNHFTSHEATQLIVDLAMEIDQGSGSCTCVGEMHS